jgi:hypothetical protein
VSKSEAEIQAEIQIKCVGLGANLMRNNSGALKDANGRLVRFGLANVSKHHNDRIKSSDLIGFTRVVVTPQMVGKTLAVFTAIEVKEEEWKPSNDKREQAQRAFVDWVKSHGGIAGIVNCWEAARDIIGCVF